MILIVTDRTDQSTNAVVEWIDYFGGVYFIITEEDIIDIIWIKITGEFCFSCRDRIIYSSDISATWYRRGGLRLAQIRCPIYTNDSTINRLFDRFLDKENEGVVCFINHVLQSKRHINSESHCTVNKLIVLYEALKVGLKVPDTLLTSDRDLAFDFVQTKKSITKPAVHSLSLRNKHYVFGSYTVPITPKEILSYDKSFALSLIQQNIQKRFEIRVFVIDEIFYSMAIFSQKNKKTVVDFRHYDDEIPNRNVPFKLPLEIKRKIIRLMKNLQLNCGSIDLIYATDNQFYFLEINPIGQFGMTSSPCNYYIEKLIASYLINNNESNQTISK